MSDRAIIDTAGRAAVERTHGDYARPVRFGVLGPITVEDGGIPIVVAAAKERALLAILLSNANHVVTAERLIEELWAAAPPPSANKTLQTYVLHLRRFLGDRLATRHNGYLLEVLGDELDSVEFERSVAKGRLELMRGDAHQATRTLGAALALWRGEAYADVDSTWSVQTDTVRLEELRLSTREDWVEARLSAGVDRALVSELEVLVARHPLRESLWALLMQALYRSGRQADALRAFQRARGHLIDELGVEPGPELRAVEAAILGHRLVLFTPTYQAPEVRYVPNADGLQIAYWAIGDGPRDVLFVGDIFMNLELMWELSGLVPVIDRIGQASRLVAVQRRGTGLSDRDEHTALASPQACVQDIDAVVDALACERVAIVGWGHGGQVAVAYASARPRRVTRMAVINSYARLGATPDYPEGMPQEMLEGWLDFVGQTWGKNMPVTPIFGPAGDDPTLIARLGRLERLTATARDAVAMHRNLNAFDVREALLGVACPVLVVHLDGSMTTTAVSRYLAERLPSARYVELPGHFVPTAIEAIALGEEVAQFLHAR